MLILLLLSSILSISSSAPIRTRDYIVPVTPVTFLGRELPECMNIKRFRTKQDIIWSCFITIFACIWVAVHPNVPDQRHSGCRNLFSRVLIMVCTLVAPEFIAMWAMRQRIGAAKHAAAYNAKFFPGLQPKSFPEILLEWFNGREDDRTDGRWTLTHGFLLEMEGLKVDNEMLYDVNTLSKPLEIPEEQIQDKSKGDALTKLVVVLQTTWFIVQCLARWIAQLPVTELEVVTLAFAVLNFVTYLLWWHKPQSMQVPIQVKKSRKVKFQQDWRMLVREMRKKAEGVSQDGDLGQQIQTSKSQKQSLADPVAGPATKPRKVAGTIMFIFGALQILCLGIIASVAVTVLAVLFIVGATLVCLTLSPVLLLSLLILMLGDNTGFDSMRSAFYSSQDAFESTSIINATCIIGMIFGGLHVIPIWTPGLSFPTSAEKLIWQICSICITAVPFFVLIARPILSSIYFLSFWAGFSYIITRVVLLVVALTTLRDLPQDAYRNIVWTDFLPHF